MTKDHRAFGVHPTIPFRLLTKNEMAQLLNCTVRTIDRMIVSHRIPVMHIPTAAGRGTRVRFDSRTIEKWLESFVVDVEYTCELNARLRAIVGKEQS